MVDIIYRLPLVKRTTGLSRSAIYKFIKQGKFPKQINLGGRCVGWLESEIKLWLVDKIMSRHKIEERK